MEDTYEARKQYEYALKLAHRQFVKDKFKKKNCYIEALDEILNTNDYQKVNLGIIDVPSDLIVGTKTILRKTSFSSNYLPLLNERSEFAYKWINVCKYHLSDNGISTEPKVYEYMGKFYVEEGNKRVSVLKSYKAVLIPCDVTRILPTQTKGKEVEIYNEFLEYYEKSKLYSIQFKKRGYYQKLVKLMGFDNDYEWNRKDRVRLIGFYERLVENLKKKKIDVYYPDSLVVLMEIYGYENLYGMSDKELQKAISDSKKQIINDKAHYSILCVSDEEDHAIYNGYEKLKDYDIVLSAGDLKKEYLEYIVFVSGRDLFYVLGNHDKEEPEGCISIDGKAVEYRGLRIAGLGGSYRYSSSGQNMYTEVQMKRRVNSLKRQIRKIGGVDIIVTHAPIAGIGDLDDYAHQGFECFKELIDEFHPKYFLFGHVHRSYDYKYIGYYDYHGTQVINVAGKRKIIY